MFRILRSEAASKTLLVLLLSGAVASGQTRPRYSSSPGERNWTIPADTVISLQMQRSLTSRTSRVGDRFIATVTRPVYVRNEMVIAPGVGVEGHVTQVVPAKRMGKPGMIAVEFDELVFADGSRVALNGFLTSDDPELREKIDEESRVSGERDRRAGVFIGGGGAVGAVLGGVIAGGKGAVFGGVIGASVGLAGVLLSKGEEAEVLAGTPFGIQLRHPLVIYDRQVNQRPAGAARQGTLRTQPEIDRTADTTVEPRHTDPVNEPPEEVATQPEEIESTPEPEPVVEEALPLSSSEMIRRAQMSLRDEGYYEGAVDGQMGPRTEAALRTYQREQGIPETGTLTDETARRLGILRARSTVSPQRAPDDEVVLARVIEATATRAEDGAIVVVIVTEANTGGWRWFGEHVVNGDTLEVFARAVRPQGVVTQAITRGRIELRVADGVDYVTRVAVNGENGLRRIALTQPGSTAGAAQDTNLQHLAEEVLSDYERAIGVQLSGTRVELGRNSRAGDAEIEMLFALDSLVNACQLYSRMATSLNESRSRRGAVVALAREARRTDRLVTTSDARGVDLISAKWDRIRQIVLELMKAHNVSISEIE